MNSGGRQATPLFLRGSFRTCPLSELFGVLAVSRQFLGVRFSRGGQEVGAMAIKAGQVLRAEDYRSAASGADALNALMVDPGTAFAVTMLPAKAPEARNGAPLCGLADLLPEEDGGNHAAAVLPSGEVIGTDEVFEVSGPQFPAGSPQHNAVEAAPGLPAEREDARLAWDDELNPLGAEFEAAPPEPPPPEAPPAADAAEPAPASPPEREDAHLAWDDELDLLGAEPPDAAFGAAPPEPPPPEVPPAAPPPPEDSEPIMQGRADDASFDEILEILQLSDRRVVVSFLRGDAGVGAMTVESGQVLAAAAGGLHGMEAFRRLHADHGETFEIRYETAEHAGEPLGSVPELLAAMRHPAPTPAAPDAPESRGALFMRGRMADLPLHLLIGSLGLSRQPIDVEFRRGEAILHRLHVKAGMIVGAESVSGDGAAHALAAIRGDPGEEFCVYRRSAPLDGEPVASLAALVAEPEGPGEAGPKAPAPRAPIPAPDAAARQEAVAETADAEAAGAVPEIAPYAPAAELEAFRERVIAEIQAALAASGRGRRDRLLLWSILGLQIASLAIVLGATVLP